MLSAKHEQAALATYECTQWPIHELTPQQALARDFFLDMVLHHPASVFAQWRDHPFWPLWRSKKTNKGVLMMVCCGTGDIQWVDVLLSHLPNADAVASVGKIFNHPKENILPLMQIFAKHGIFAQHPETAVVAARGAARAGYIPALEMLMRANHLPNRVSGVEANFVAGKKTTFTDSITTLEEMYAWLWTQWGEPDAATWQDCWSEAKRVMASQRQMNSRTQAAYMVARHWSPQHPQWTDEDSLDVLVYMGKRHCWNALHALLDQGWKFPDHVWNKWYTELRPHQHCEETNFVHAHRQQLLLHAQVQSHASAPLATRLKKM